MLCFLFLPSLYLSSPSSVSFSLRPSKSTFSPSEMAQLKERGGVRGFLDDFISCPDTVRQVRRENLVNRAFSRRLGGQQWGDHAVSQEKGGLQALVLQALVGWCRGTCRGSLAYDVMSRVHGGRTRFVVKMRKNVLCSRCTHRFCVRAIAPLPRPYIAAPWCVSGGEEPGGCKRKEFFW